MRRGLRFQTKLLLSFLLSTLLVTVAVIELTGNKVRNAYERQFQRRFGNQVQAILEAREKRSESFLELGRRLARSELVVARLREPEADGAPAAGMLKELLAEVRPATGRGKGEGERKPSVVSLPAGRNLPILAVMNLEGEIFYLESGWSGRGAGQRSPAEASRIRSQLEALQREDIQQIAYLPETLKNGEEVVRDVIITPVRDPGSGELLGGFLMSLTTTETGAERLIDRYHQQTGEGHFENAIYIGGKLYPSRYSSGESDNGLEQARMEDLERAVREEMARKGAGFDLATFEADLHGEPHYIHYCALNPDSPLNVAWQVAAFPLSELRAELNDLRLKGSGIGLAGLLVGMTCAWILARKLSVPICDLSVGTRRVREGNLEEEIPVRSRDELGELTIAFNEMMRDLREKEQYRNLLEKVSDESVAQAMIEGTLNPELGGEVRRVTVLFCDIRGFTELTETMPPEDVIEILNEHMTAMTRVVRENLGVVDKFVGDEIMAVFGALKSYGNNGLNACRAARAMREERDRINGETGMDIQIGVGLATGDVLAGCMGSADRLNYTVLGARVNLGARLCGRAGPGEILMDEETWREIGETDWSIERVEGLRLRGFQSIVGAGRMLRSEEESERAPLARTGGG